METLPMLSTAISSSPADERDHFQHIPRLELRVILLAPHQPAIELDGHLVRRQPMHRQHGMNIRALGQLAGLSIDGNGHGGPPETPLAETLLAATALLAARL